VLVVPASLLACCTSVIVELAETAKVGVVIRTATRSVNRIALSKCGQILAQKSANASQTILSMDPFPKMNEMFLTYGLGRAAREYHRNQSFEVNRLTEVNFN
jgi:hypothetical protein